MWELKTARDLRPNRTFVVRGNSTASARKVTGPLTVTGDELTVPAPPLYPHPTVPDSVTFSADTPVYILTCTCNGMAFICNRWTFTGECSCVRIPLPKED